MRAFDYRNRTALRKTIEPFDVSDLYFTDKFGAFASKAKIVDVSATGILMQVDRKDLHKKYKKNFNLEDIVGEQLFMQIELMDLDIDGVITRTRSTSKDTFEIAIDYSAGAPEYWRECLVDLLPSDEEDLDEEFSPFIDEWE